MPMLNPAALTLAFIFVALCGPIDVVAGEHGNAGGRPIDVRAAFVAVGAMYGIDPGLLEAIAEVESRGAAQAVSPAGAMGLMQLMPATAARFGVEDPFDPVESALGAARFIDALRCDSATGDLSEILAAYNAGEEAVARFGGIPPYPETRDYVRRVLWLYLLGAPPWISAGRPTRRTEASPPLREFERSGSHHGDGAVLAQLAELKRLRAAAAAGAPAAGER